MSADNGVYILQCKDQYRVNHIQAIGNLYDGNSEEYDIIPTMAIHMFGGVKYTKNLRTASYIASLILQRLPICEYGISFIKCNETWDELLQQAKKLAAFEIEQLKVNLKENDVHSKYKVKILSNVLSY